MEVEDKGEFTSLGGTGTLVFSLRRGNNNAIIFGTVERTEITSDQTQGTKTERQRGKPGLNARRGWGIKMTQAWPSSSLGERERAVRQPEEMK